jgi:ribosome biogenesis GTPase
MVARVYKSTGSRYTVKNTEGLEFHVRLKGKLKTDNITSTNPIAVGDFVEVENEEDAGSMVVSRILPRKNYINRVSPHNKNQQHIVAANLDQSLLFVTLKEPKTSLGFIDRFLITSEAYHVPAILVFNKVDLYKIKDKEKLETIADIYKKIGYTIVFVSMTMNHGIEELMELLKDKTTLLSGHSGVGKSTFINTLFPDLDIRTKDVSGWSGKGMHTTTFAEMYDLPQGGSIIDTPGIRELGLVDIDKYELCHYFPEMRKLMHNCQFNNCVHINEPGCAVKKAVSEAEISEERYFSYLNILEGLPANKYT